MNYSKEKKSLSRLSLLYGVIIVLVNYLGFVVASSSNMPIMINEDFNKWEIFLDGHRALASFNSICSFLIPSLLCVFYFCFCPEKKVIKRIINIPIAFSLFGSLGWLISLFLETILLLYLHINNFLNMWSIWLSSAFNMILICIFIGTFGFLIMDLIHRKLILVRMFPEGNISKYPGVIQLSAGVLIIIFYLSVGIFPVGFLISTLYNTSLTYGFKISTSLLIVIFVIMILGILITTFFLDHFSSPLRKLKEATESMANSNYDVNVDVVSGDEFGVLADTFNEMTDSLATKSRKILAIQDSIIRGMAVMVEQRDNSTGGHINRTSDCVKVFMNFLQNSDKYSFAPSFVKAVIKAAPMHDLGKIAVDDKVLRKPGRFTDEEYEIMKEHAAVGHRIVDMVLAEVDDQEFKSVTRNVAHYHHEKWNGTGYPEGISGEHIPIEARIMALADVFDALVSKRCYKEAMGYDKAFEIIKNDLGTHFDPELGQLFLECKDELIELYESYSEESTQS